MEAQAALDATRTGTSRLFIVVDADDPKVPEYQAVCRDVLVAPPEQSGTMVKALNWAAAGVIEGGWSQVLGFIGDDHRFRTPGWDRLVIDDIARLGSGFVYGDDLAQRKNLPTQVFISASIISALGWMAPPFLRHLYVDDAWLKLGKFLQRITYDPRIVIEHLHPAYAKAEWDEGYVRVNSEEMYGHDRTAFEGWMSKGFLDDVAKVRATL